MLYFTQNPTNEGANSEVNADSITVEIENGAGSKVTAKTTKPSRPPPRPHTPTSDVIIN